MSAEREAAIRYSVGRLLAAYPAPEPPDETAELYVERLMRHCSNTDCLAAAINDLIDSGAQWLPRIGKILEVYQRNLPAFAPRALMERGPSEEERKEMAQRVRAMTEHLAARGESGHSEDFESCEHPDCVAAR